MARMTIDDAPLNGFHLRVTAYTTGGEFCDGYILGVVGIALTQITPQMHLDAFANGLIGASALIGIFVGSIVFGPITDRIGRQTMYTADLLAFVVGSVLQFFVQDPWQLFALRLLMGVAVGADYAIGAALLSEVVPRRHRGPLLACLNAVWTVGYVVASLVGYAMLGLGPDAWRWLLASSAVPAAIVVLARLGTPESPRWLISKGRRDEAAAIVRRYIHPDCGIDDLHPDGERYGYRVLFSPRYLRRTVFACVFWFCQVLPFFAISTFVPEIFKALHFSNAFTSSLVYNVFQLAGAVLGVLVMNLFPRRRFVIWSFAVIAAALLFLGAWPSAPIVAITIAFAIFAFVVSGAGNLETVYPSELFPTEIRASGCGLAAAFSRIGAAGGTFLLPIVLASWGVGPALLGGAAVGIIGLAVSIAWAPETRGQTLLAASTDAVPSTSPS
ncbi:MAG: MFS transporter [Candidatus Dormiibacterota bacterium]